MSYIVGCNKLADQTIASFSSFPLSPDPGSDKLEENGAFAPFSSSLSDLKYTQLAVLLAKQSLEPSREQELLSQASILERAEGTADEIIETFEQMSFHKQVQELASSTFYIPPCNPKSGDVDFVEFGQNKAIFYYPKLYDVWIGRIYSTFTSLAKDQKFVKYIKGINEPVDGQSGLKRNLEVCFSTHEAAHKFFRSNCEDLINSLQYLKEDQKKAEKEFFEMSTSAQERMNRLHHTKYDHFNKDDFIRESNELKKLKRKLYHAIHSKDFGLVAQHEIIQERLQKFQVHAKARQMLKSKESDRVHCPFLFGSETWTFQKTEDDCPDVTAEALVQFYNEYEVLLCCHRQYFSNVIIAHQQLYVQIKEWLKWIDDAVEYIPLCNELNF